MPSRSHLSVHLASRPSRAGFCGRRLARPGISGRVIAAHRTGWTRAAARLERGLAATRSRFGLFTPAAVAWPRHADRLGRIARRTGSDKFVKHPYESSAPELYRDRMDAANLFENR